MRITTILLFKINSISPDEGAILLASATDVSDFSYVERSSIREFIVLISRNFAQRVIPGIRISIQFEGLQYKAFKVLGYKNREGLCALSFMDYRYPAWSAFALINQVLDEYPKQFGDSWKTAESDSTDPWPYLDDALIKYQDPAEADKLRIIQEELSETKIILQKTIDGVLERGERTDSLVEKSSDPSAASQMFHKQGKKTNQCCTIL